MKKRVLIVVIFLLSVLAIGLALTPTDPAVGEGVEPGPSDNRVQVLQSLLESKQIETSAVLVEGDTVSIDRVLSSAYGIDAEIDRWETYRAATKAGFTFLKLTSHLGAQQAWEGHSLSLSEIPRQDHQTAQANNEKWLGDLEAKLGVQASHSFADHRLDVLVQGPREMAPVAAENLMMGGSVLHDSGSLEVLTIVFKSGTETVFEGVCDYVVGAQSRLYQAPDLSFDW